MSAPVPVDLKHACAAAYFRHFNAPTFHVHLAEVEVDPDTGRVTILRYVVAQDVGRVIDPNGIEGQIHGGVAQGIGYALYENIRIEDGRVLESDFESYRLPGHATSPASRPSCSSTPIRPARSAPRASASRRSSRPAAIANAVSDAVGRHPRLPITPFDVLAALRGDT